MEQRNKKESGFTIIELVVATGIFSLVISMIFSIYILAAGGQRRVIAVKNTQDNARFALEAMAREIRTGMNFSGGGSTLTFTNARAESVIYRLNNGAIEKSSDGGATFAALTGPEVTINTLGFYVLGQAPGDGIQPRVTITIGITSQVGNQTSNLKVQTTVSERLLQI